MIRIEQLTNALHASIEIRLQLVGELLSCCFIAGVRLVSKGKSRIVHPAEVLRLVGTEQSVEKVYNSPGSRRVLTMARCERARYEREERAIDERIPVDEE